MELHLQFGFGMMEHCRHLLTEWGGGTVVLSPRDLNDKQLRSLAEDVAGIEGGRTLLDPQFYVPHADHDRLCSHGFWPADFTSGSFFQGPEMESLVRQIVELNKELGTEAIILPGILANPVDDLWLAHHESFVTTARDIAGGIELYATLALGADTARSREQVTALLESVTRWKADGYYIVCEHPNGEYLVQDAIWLAHVLDLTAGLRLAGAQVILGYCNHQMLVAHVAGANAICSGTWMNVRSFPPDKFSKDYEEEIRRRATWYYCPQVLSEYKIPFLDVAYAQGVLDLMKPPPELDGGYVGRLFSGVQPSSVRISEQAAFRHYLHALRGQALALKAESYDEARRAHEQMINDAEALLGTLGSNGVLGANREFTDSLDVNRAALAMLDRQRGAVLRRRWTSLQ
ncbi:MAG: hypothetical protein KJ066_22785 [Acidobacteria bacterium]|nr:hypothetical protein [Acidobacteriota bacterium]